MNLIQFIRLILRNWRWLLLIPALMAISTWYFTRKMGKEYLASTLVYTGLASGFNIETTGTSRWDNYAINNAFDNLINTIKSRETLREVSFRLLALHLSQPSGMGEKVPEDLLPDSLRKKWVVLRQPEVTYARLEKAYQGHHPQLRALFHGRRAYYSLHALSQVSAQRKGSSDMVEISYKADHREVCEQTLRLLVEVFTRRYKYLKVSETGDVVAYFEKQLQKAKNKLNGAEENLKAFREKGRILNYYEQTKFIAGKKEDITDEFRRLTGEVNASRAVVEELENKLQIDRSFFFKNDELLRKKNQLAELSASLALQEVNATDPAQLQPLRHQAAQLESQLQKNVLDLYSKSHSTEGVPIKNLLNEWLEHTIIQEQSKARAEILEQRLGEIDRQYDEFAPLGSGLSRLEREINVHERAYIEILHGLNLALLRQQNIEMSSNLEIVDSPSTLDLGSKRMLLIILAYLVGWILCLGGLVAREMLDTTLKTPERALKSTGLALGGAFPLLREVQQKAKSQIATVLTHQLWANLKIAQPAPLEGNPLQVAFVSIQEQEGKSLLMHQLAQKMRAAGQKVLQIYPASPDRQSPTHPDDRQYPVGPQLLEMRQLADLMPQEVSLSDYAYVLLEIPALLGAQTPLELLKSMDLCLLTLRANRSWNATDAYLTRQLTQLKGRAPLLLLNGVRFAHLEGLIGQTGQAPNSWRARIKRWIRLELNHRSFQVQTKKSI